MDPPPPCPFHHICLFRNSGVGQILGWCQGALVEAPDLHGMVPTSTPNIYKVFESIHIHFHYHTPLTIFLCFEFRELANILGDSSAGWQLRCKWWCQGALDVKVHWLSPQTYMEWFPHPLQTYTRCLRAFICCTGSDGSVASKLKYTAYSTLAAGKILNFGIFEFTCVYSNLHGHFVAKYRILFHKMTTI